MAAGGRLRNAVRRTCCVPVSMRVPAANALRIVNKSEGVYFTGDRMFCCWSGCSRFSAAASVKVNVTRACELQSFRTQINKQSRAFITSTWPCAWACIARYMLMPLECSELDTLPIIAPLSFRCTKMGLFDFTSPRPRTILLTHLRQRTRDAFRHKAGRAPLCVCPLRRYLRRCV